jgi:hypothetical protein
VASTLNRWRVGDAVSRTPRALRSMRGAALIGRYQFPASMSVGRRYELAHCPLTLYDFAKGDGLLPYQTAFRADDAYREHRTFGGCRRAKTSPVDSI